MFRERKMFILTIILVGISIYLEYTEASNHLQVSERSYSKESDLEPALSYEILETGASSSSFSNENKDQKNVGVLHSHLNRRRRSPTHHHSGLGYGIYNGYQLYQQKPAYVQPVHIQPYNYQLQPQYQIQPQYQLQPQYHHQPYANHYYNQGHGKEVTNSHAQAQAVSAQIGGRDGGIGIVGSSASAGSSAGADHLTHTYTRHIITQRAR